MLTTYVPNVDNEGSSTTSTTSELKKQQSCNRKYFHGEITKLENFLQRKELKDAKILEDHLSCLNTLFKKYKKLVEALTDNDSELELLRTEGQ